MAEAVLNIFSGVKYVMLDAVPGSLMFAYFYLCHQFPEKKVGFYYNEDIFDMDQYDLYICPSWHFEKLNKYSYDAAINLSSFQEMEQKHVDYYLDLFDRVVSEDGIVYVHNSREYVFRGKWNYPKRWERLYMYNMPGSWTDIYPAEIFRKKLNEQKCLQHNNFIEAGYFWAIHLLKSEKAQRNCLPSVEHKQVEAEKYLMLEENYRQVLNSKSWKITAPLRAMGKILKR